MTAEPEPASDPFAALLAWQREMDAQRRRILVHPDRLDAVAAVVDRLGMGGLIEVRGSAVVPEGQAIVLPVDDLPDWAR